MSPRKQKRSPKSPRRKAGSKAKATRPAKLEERSRNRKLTFRLVVEAQEMLVTYTPNSFGDDYPHGQFEFKSTRRPAKRIAISETGYYSTFEPMREVRAAKSPQAYARDIVTDYLDRQRRTMRGYDKRQLPLF